MSTAVIWAVIGACVAITFARLAYVAFTDTGEHNAPRPASARRARQEARNEAVVAWARHIKAGLGDRTIPPAAAARVKVAVIMAAAQHAGYLPELHHEPKPPTRHPAAPLGPPEDTGTLPAYVDWCKTAPIEQVRAVLHG